MAPDPRKSTSILRFVLWFLQDLWAVIQITLAHLSIREAEYGVQILIHIVKDGFLKSAVNRTSVNKDYPKLALSIMLGEMLYLNCIFQTNVYIWEEFIFFSLLLRHFSNGWFLVKNGHIYQHIESWSHTVQNIKYGICQDFRCSCR